MAAPGLKVSLFLPALNHGGVAVSMAGLANQLQARGHQVDVVVLRGGGALEGRLSGPVRLVDLGRGRARAALPALVRYLMRSKPDVLVSAIFHINALAVAAKLLMPMRPLRVIASQRASMALSVQDKRSFWNRISIWLAPLVYRIPRYLVCVSKGLREEMIGSLGLPPERVVAIYNPIATQAAMRQAEERPVLPAFGDPSHPLIVTTGRLADQKDHDTLIRAFALFVRRRPARLLIIGDGENRGQLESLAAGLGVADRVCFAGFLDRPLGYMSQADLFVLSSIYEGFGNVLVEALLCGLPIVSTDCDFGPSEILGEGRWGRLVPVRDPEALAAAMQATFDAPPAAQAQRQRALDFTDAKAADLYESLFPDPSAAGAELAPTTPEAGGEPQH